MNQKTISSIKIEYDDCYVDIIDKLNTALRDIGIVIELDNHDSDFGTYVKFNINKYE